MICAVSSNDAYLIVLVLLLLFHGFVPSKGQSNGDLRLNNDGSPLMSNVFEGRLEVYLNSEWGTVCDDNFRHAEANVACRQLGFVSALSFGVAGRLGFNDGKDEVLIYLDQVNCTGKEDGIHLLSCVDSDAHMNHDCSHTEDVALICNKTLLSDAGPFDGQVRLTGGEYPSLGLVEVYCNGQWGTVCDDLFSYEEANTICAQLGYNRAVDYDHINLFGNESQSIWMDNVNCGNGQQCLTSCQTCPKEEFHNCGHHEDVTVECSYEFHLNVDGYSTVGIDSCEIHKSDSKINGEIIVVILVSVIFVVLCFALCFVCIAFVVCWRRKLKSSISDDSMSNVTEMTRSTASTQPIPPPRPTDLPPLSTPSSAFSQTFSPFSPFMIQSQPLLPPRPQNLLPTPTNPINPGMFSPFPMPPSSQGIYESTPVYITPDKTGRYIYIDPSDTKQELPPLPSGINYYERTPTGAAVIVPDEGTDSVDHYESIPPLVQNTYADCRLVLDRSPARKKNNNVANCKPDVEIDKEEYEKLHSEASQKDVCKENCYDNLEPPQDTTEISKVDLAAECAGNIDKDNKSVTEEECMPISIASPKHKVSTNKTEPAAAYVNVKDVQAEVMATIESSSYDVLRPAEMTNESVEPTESCTGEGKNASTKLYCNVDEFMDN